MKLISLVNSAVIPFVIGFIVIYAMYKRIDVFGAFVKGTEEGLKTSFSVLPSLIALICAVKVLRASSFFEILSFLWCPLEKVTSFPSELVPLAAAKMFSSSAAMGLLTDIFENYGPDSYIGRTASIMMCCSETIFYTLSVYFAPVGIKDSRYIIKCTLVGLICGIAVSAFIASKM
ncbi:MAG: spore maturation protein [Firmicutes bacterium]|nr:spore maturation protein [Bacillota bacterium]